MFSFSIFTVEECSHVLKTVLNITLTIERMKSQCTLSINYFCYFNQILELAIHKNPQLDFPHSSIYFKILSGEIFPPRKSDRNWQGDGTFTLELYYAGPSNVPGIASGLTSPFPSGCEVLTVAPSIDRRVT